MNGLLGFLQSASNTAANTVSGPVDLIAAGLRKVGVPVPEDPVAGANWMKHHGLLRDVPDGPAKVLGETAGMLTPALAMQYAPQIASVANKAISNAMAPTSANKELGAIRGGDIAEALSKKYGDAIDAYLMEGDKIHLSKVVVPKEARNKGVGSEFMQDLVQYADDAGKTVTLTPSSDFGGSKSRLEQFYKRFDFVPNKGRSKDYEISEAMYRLPKE